MAGKQVRVLTLNVNENKQHVLYRLEKGWSLRLVLGPSLHASPVRVFCNHPPSKATSFERKTYYELPWKSVSGSRSDSNDVYTEVPIVTAGSFNYFFTIDKSDNIENSNGHGYFLVDPTLCLTDGDEEEEITLDCIQCQTVLSKSLGPFDEWEGRLWVAKETGYNLVHFTPIQELGQSNSAYSLCDQLKVNHIFSRHGQSVGYKEVGQLIKKMEKDWKILSLTDLVFNHTADNSPWLQEHPECAYNLDNSPYLKPAYLADRIFSHFSDDVADGKYTARGLPPLVGEKEQLKTMQEILLWEVFPSHKLYEFYTLDIEEIMKRFRHGILENRMISSKESSLDIIQDPTYRRKQCRVDMDTALKLYNTDRPGVTNRNERIKVCCDILKDHLEGLNRQVCEKLNDHIATAIKHYIENVRWRFLNPAGPQVGTVTKKEPLMFHYFIVPPKYQGSLITEEGYMYGNSAKFVFASNGWVMGDDPLKNFAAPGTTVYLRRELVAWGDSAKLRYGDSEADCPYLWQRMKEYTERTARIFHGIRLDNCHSTPIHVAEYMMDAARKIRPDLYIIAELFTGGEHLDNLFMNRLGINSLIREALSSSDAHDLGRQVHRYGGLPVGAFIQPRVQPLVPTVAHALFFDQTHDNESFVEKHCPFDLLPSAALVSMACCAVGSNRGFDQMVPHHIHVVKEDRLYTSWSQGEFPAKPFINHSFGITRGKTLLNRLHNELGNSGFSQAFVDQIDGNVVAVTRHNPQTHVSVVLIARTSFGVPANPEETGYIRPITVQGQVEEVLFEMRTCETKAYGIYEMDKEFINGLPNYYLEEQENIPPTASNLATVETSGDQMTSQILLKKFTPGSVIAVRCVLPEKAKKAILQIRRGLGQFGYLMRSYSGRTMFDMLEDKSSFRAIVSELTLADLNIALFRCSVEEEADGNGFGPYNIPNYGSMLYCGIRGVMTVLGDIRSENNLGHPLCGNLREGNWLPNYIANRLKVHQGTKDLGEWFGKVFQNLENVPRYLVPCYFDAVVTGAYVVLRQHAFSLMSEFVQDGAIFVQALAIGSVMFCGYVKSSRLPFLSPNLEPPKPPTVRVEQPSQSAQTQKGEESPVKEKESPVKEEEPSLKGEESLVKGEKPPVKEEESPIKEEGSPVKEEETCLSLAAGFIHFAAGFARNWGRDTFISLRGLLLLTGRYQEARYLILAYGGCLRHGLIPNLLCEGTGSRYNCRDATWWWLQAIQEYCKLAPDGVSILQDKVSRLYPTDDSPALPPGEHDQPLCDVMQEALQVHAFGCKFRERNAGIQIDEQMSDKGFNNEIGVEWDNGFVFGGSEFNCGTWMDKMGSSERAGNKGKPATPRDGSAVELIGLSASALVWLDDLQSQGQYPFKGVKVKTGDTEKLVTFKEWADLIKDNFEKYFWISTEPQEEEINPKLIFKRGMYKDTFNSSQYWANTQLRPNVPIAMVVAPWLFTPANAWTALNTIQEHLLGPLGMKTLEPSDWSYVGYYDNTNDGDDPKIAKGFSYHQGPEWVWPIGYFLRAKLYFASVLNKERPGLLQETIGFLKTRLTRHYQELMSSRWRSLPELTNAMGEPNYFSCPAQAWSIGTILEVLYDLETLGTSPGVQASSSGEDDTVAPL